MIKEKDHEKDKETETSPWNAEKAYRIVYEGEYLNRWLICYKDRIVELITDFDLSESQIETASQKVMNY